MSWRIACGTLWSGVLLVGNVKAAQPEVAVVAPPGNFSIQSIAVQGTNLAFVATVPPNVSAMTLDSRPSLDADWQAAALVSVANGATQVDFTIPAPTNSMCLFRLEASLSAGSTPMVSSELTYVAIPSLAGQLTTNGEAIFHFKGMVDGSDKIELNHAGALWSHVNYQWPLGPVAINGSQWNPKEKNYLTTVGSPKFLPDSFSLAGARLEVIKGRDVVALERTADGLAVYIDDTPNGADEYEFNVLFPPVTASPDKPAAPTVATLKIDADIDGSDRLKITSTEATWEHTSWGWPQNVSLNGVTWNPWQTNVLANTGTNTFLPAWVDLSTARITSRKGRDVAAMWADKEAVWVWFGDNPGGGDAYELNISFGKNWVQ